MKGQLQKKTWLSFSFRVPQGIGQKLRLNRLEDTLPRLVNEETGTKSTIGLMKPHSAGGKAGARAESERLPASSACSPRDCAQRKEVSYLATL